MKHHILATAAALLVCLPAAGTAPYETVLAAEAGESGTCGDALTWTFDESTGVLHISGTGAMYDGNMRGGCYFNRYGFIDAVRQVVIDEGVTRIGDMGFCDLTQVRELTIPASVTEIGMMALLHLETVTILNPACFIHDGNVYSELQTVRGYPGSTAQDFAEKYGYAFVPLTGGPVESGSCGENVIWTFDWGTGVLALSGTGAMEDYAIYRDGNERIPYRSVQQAIRRLVAEEGVTGIGNGAFAYCQRLESMELPGTLRTIGSDAFAECGALHAVYLPESVTSIGGAAFALCEGDVYLPNPACEIGGAGETLGRMTVHGRPGSAAEAYAAQYGRTFVPLRALGDLNGDGAVNASDAARTLTAAAVEGATGACPLSQEERTAADVNRDHAVNASDAALLLMYAAAAGTGFSGDVEAYLACSE